MGIMEVRLEKDYRKHYTLEDADRAMEVISVESGDMMTINEYAEIAVREAVYGSGELVRIIMAEAHTAKNHRVWNLYTGNSADMDVWIDFLAETDFGYINGGAYLSDIMNCFETNGFKQYMHIKIARWEND